MLSKKVFAAAITVLIACFGVAAMAEELVYHEIQTDSAGHIIPWYDSDPGKSYDHCIGLVWNFWNHMESCPNGVKYYLQHQVWSPEHDPRGLGGSQPAMALNSWTLLYAYSGDSAVHDNMQLIADYVLEHGVSDSHCKWPNLIYPYNTEVHSGVYDGDMVAGKGVLQPDKAATFAAELVVLYKITGTKRYLDAAVAIADSLASRVVPGDNDSSPWPFRVNAETGEVVGAYTANWTGALRLFDELIDLKVGDVNAYAKTRDIVVQWLKNYPIKTNKWGPFFEDIPIWSDTEINADTLAWYILEHPTWSDDWKQVSRNILDWTQNTFGNAGWAQYGVIAINEQTAYKFPGNSHTSRHWSVELLWAEKTGDWSRKDDAVRALNWATYMVDVDGKNRYLGDLNWLTDGYGDYVQHYLRAMAACPTLTPKGQNHLLSTSSVVRKISYDNRRISYTVFDPAARELLTLAFAPSHVKVGGVDLPKLSSVAELDKHEGYVVENASNGSAVLRIRHDKSNDVEITGESPSK
jgi:hypothetical protein